MKRTSGQRQDVPYLSREDIEAEAALVLKLLLREASDDRLAREVLADPYAKTRVNSPMDRRSSPMSRAACARASSL
jgi:hypothetical protein